MDYRSLEDCIKWNCLDHLIFLAKEKKFPELKGNEIDIASEYGRINILDWWIQSGIPFNYSSNAVDMASKNGHFDVLEWWKSKDFLEFKYTSKAIDLASEFGKLEVLEWWVKSGLKFLCTTNAIDNISKTGRYMVLEWWIENYLNGRLMYLLYSELSVEIASNLGFVKILDIWNKSGLFVKRRKFTPDSLSKNNDEKVMTWWVLSGLLDKDELSIFFQILGN